ncbi:MAG: hypothetical protein ACI9UQ_002295 [Candidatus Krumholzibacteriia bacterium]
MQEIQRRWDLWNLKTLFPDWGAAELDGLLVRGAAYDERQREMFGDPRAAYKKFGGAARQVLVDHPELKTGLTLSLHVGPYSLAPVPWLASGVDVSLLVNRSSLAEIKPIYDSLHGHLGLPGEIKWVPIEGKQFVLKLARALRNQEPVFAFLDGNDGLQGSEGTLRQGIAHQLPGRAIRVRTGLARLALRLKCPVHTLVTRWDELEGFRWHRGPSWHWPPEASVDAATNEFYTWGFDVIRRHPAQWRAWNMLTGVSDGFRTAAQAPEGSPADSYLIVAARHRETRYLWQREAKLWPGDMLEDVEGDCFYDAAGLQKAELEVLQGVEGFTPNEMAERLGEQWVQDHLPRLLALGFVASSLGS